MADSLDDVRLDRRVKDHHLMTRKLLNMSDRGNKLESLLQMKDMSMVINKLRNECFVDYFALTESKVLSNEDRNAKFSPRVNQYYDGRLINI